MSLQKQPSHVGPEIWHTCAGAAVKIPKLHSRVYYFPQGHLENASPSSSSITHTHSLLQSFRPFTPCIVSAVDLLADPHTDEVFVKLLLYPITNDVHVENPKEVPNLNDGDQVVSFVKILTRSDVNNARSFHIPRFCADNVFPPLNIEAKSSSQHLLVTDVHGEVSKFYHVCRGFPKRNMLYISEWNSFVKRKKLVAGDSVIFMKNSTGKIFVGIRRNMQFVAAAAEQKKDELEKAVMEAVKLAEEKKAFEIVYYPRGDDWCDFVVDGNVVDESMKIQWNPRMRVKMKTDKSSRIPYQGTISTLSRTSNFWRMLQVNWDEFQVSQTSRRVSPWWVELISHKPASRLPFPQTKKIKTDQSSAQLSDKKGSLNQTMISLNQTLLNYDAFPSDVQRVRHDLVSISGPSNILNEKGNSFFEITSTEGLSNVSKELNISPIHDKVSPHSHIILNSSETKFPVTHNCDTKNDSDGSIKLFGKIIQPDVSNFHNSHIKGDDGYKSCDEVY